MIFAVDSDRQFPGMFAVQLDLMAGPQWVFVTTHLVDTDKQVSG